LIEIRISDYNYAFRGLQYQKDTANQTLCDAMRPLRSQVSFLLGTPPSVRSPKVQEDRAARISKPTSGVNTGDSRLRLSSGRKKKTCEDLGSIHRRFPPSLVFGSEDEDSRGPVNRSVTAE